MVCKRIIIRGEVQGVYFRAATKEKAEELGVEGEVRKLPDGSVEVLVSGAEEKVAALIRWCHDGPPRAEVKEVSVSDLPFTRFEGFRVVRR